MTVPASLPVILSRRRPGVPACFRQGRFQSSYNTASSEKYQPTKLLWDKADIGYYQSVLGFNLSTIALPVDALLCTNVDCQLHRDIVETYYKQLIGSD